MISREQVAELRKKIAERGPLIDSWAMPVELMLEHLDTLEALWKVAEAAKKYVLLDPGRSMKRDLADADLAMREAIAALEEKK